MLEALDSFPVALVSSFSLIARAETGDKSQLVCMTLAARYRAWPVFAGAVLAFAVLNLLAVLFGAAVARRVPEQIVAGVVGVLFLLFGFHALGTPPVRTMWFRTGTGARMVSFSPHLS